MADADFWLEFAPTSVSLDRMKAPQKKPVAELVTLPRAIEESLRRLSEGGEQIDAQSVSTLQDLIDDLIDDADQGAITVILRNLAFDLLYFVADPILRSQDPSYFGPWKAGRLASEALSEIEKFLADRKT